MKKRINYYVLLLFASLSLISIGFASWSISNPEPSQNASSSGLVSSEGIINASDYITTTITNFEYFNTGFIVRDEFNETVSLSNEGILSIKVSIKDSTKFNSLNLTNPTLNITLYQKQKKEEGKISLLTSTFINSITVNNNTISNDSISYSNYQLVMSCELTNSVTEYTFNIKFKVNEDNSKTFFDMMLKNSVSFSTIATIGGTTNE